MGALIMAKTRYAKTEWRRKKRRQLQRKEAERVRAVALGAPLLRSADVLGGAKFRVVH